MNIKHEINILRDGTIDGNLNVRQFDSLSHTLSFAFPFDLTGEQVRLKIIPNGLRPPYTAYIYDCTITSNIATCTPDSAAWQNAGLAFLQAEVLDSGAVVWQSKKWGVDVSVSVDPLNGVDPAEGETLLDKLNKAAQSAEEAAEEAKKVIGIKIIDYYPTLEALQTAITSPNAGDAYGVGASEPYNIYIYSESGEWVDNGELVAGPPGDPGPPGPEGPGIKILGHYDTLANLEAAVPNPNISDNYEIGTETPYDRYTYGDSGWYNAGPIAESSEITESTPTDLTGFLAGENGLVVAKDAPVSSVNGKTGPVILTPSDVNAVPAATGTITYYVSPTGNDTTGDGSQSAPFASLQKAINMFPKYSDYTRSVTLSPGNYSSQGIISIMGFSGGGAINILGATDLSGSASYIFDKLQISNCVCNVYLRGIRAIHSEAFVGAIDVRSSSYVTISFCSMVNDGSLNSTYGLYAIGRTIIYASDCSGSGFGRNYLSSASACIMLLRCLSENAVISHLYMTYGGIISLATVLTTSGTGNTSVTLGSLLIMPSGETVGT